MAAGSLVPSLGARAWWIVAGNGIRQLGLGMTYPFLIVYLHQVRGFSLAAAGGILGVMSLAGLFTLPAAGSLIDAAGAGPALVLSLWVSALGTAGFIWVRTPWQALVTAAADGAGSSAMWSALNTALARSAAGGDRSGAFAVNYALGNLGLGIGSLLAGLVVNLARPGSFAVIFYGDAATSLLFAGLLLAAGETRRYEPGGGAPGSAWTGTWNYLAVLRDRVLLAATAVNSLLVTGGIAQLSVAFPAWATGPAHTGPRVVGLAFAANCFAIVASQLFVARWLRGRRRTGATALAAVVFAVSWVGVLVAGSRPPGGAAAWLIGALALFGFGETFMAPSLPALINDVAPEALRGRYNAVFNLAWQVGPVIGPVLTGMAFAGHAARALLLGLAGAQLAAAGLTRVMAIWVPEGVDRGLIPPA
ncbi:Putative MFS transporter [Candidatus Hydrogenisulfobacillus filiaventi]|uniref:MFS transporter n=1 Tax=Candidatus Hydrogenisulfobacillus filiaventi TaxID=2707344 RepID=A0A6F8ZKB6_9FIRM|nr:MFS transporter [Bacillota bacterium]CAB1130238.1 Putative MFS transporter [Candidatus Hydrogenisulfobacillus filiaventi]